MMKMNMITERFKLADIFPSKAAKIAQRLHIKKDEIPFVRKYYTAEKDKAEVNKKERAVVSYISTGIKDRDGERLVPEGVMLDNFQKNPVVPFAHDYKSIPPAKNMWTKHDDKGLIAKTVFAKSQRGEELLKAYTEDIGGTGPLLNAFSVGFIPLEWEDTDTKALEKNPDLPKRTYSKWELLEYSLVPIPSCPEALTIAVEKELFSKKFVKELEIEVVKDVPEKEFEITLEDIEDETKLEKKIKGEFTKRVVKDVKEHLDKEEEKMIHGDPDAEDNIDGVIEVEIEVDKIKGVKAEWVDEKEVEIEKDIVIKPEPDVTENFIRIRVRNPRDFIDDSFRTITISASKGIKAVIGKLKSEPQGSTKIQTYLFDKEKWTVAKAQVWVNENKPKYHERWNKSFSKLFDIASAESSRPMRFHFDLYEKFLECKIKEVFQNSYVIPSPLMGSYLAGFKEIFSKFDLKDTRRFGWDGDETPPNHEVVNLNSEKSDDFLVDGMEFYEAEKKPLIVNYSPGWAGLTIILTTSSENRDWNKELLDKVHIWVKENNFLRGEKFALSGEFLKEPGDNWDNLILKDKYKDAIMTSAKALEKKGEKLIGRGLLFIGPPGTGKTKTGRVLMNELDATFIWISSRDFKCIGPLRALSLGFSLARDLAPSVLFLEDIDTWLRGDMEFVTDLLKTEMDGIKQNRGMITIMTSNYPEKLPPALLDRPGRFHHIVNFELPDEEHRKEMITQWAGDIGEELLDELSKKTEGFSGAHLKELVEFAKMIAEEEEIKIGDAMLRSLDKLMEQRELIDEIRSNKTDVKSVWGRIKLIEGKIQVSEEIDSLRDPVIKELDEVKVGDREEVDIKETVEAIKVTKELWDSITKERLEELKEVREQLNEIKDLKAGRVLSRKNRNVVKDAVTALNAVLKADATGTQEDEDVEDKDDVTERTVDFVRDGDRKTYSLEDIEILTEKLVEKKAKSIIEGSFEKQSDPELIKKRVMEAVSLELDKRKGKVR